MSHRRLDFRVDLATARGGPGRRAWFVLVALVAACSWLSGCAPQQTKGTMPPPGIDGTVDASRAPDFIAVAGRESGIAGYVPKSAVLDPPVGGPGIPTVPDIPVYGDDLRTIVGHLVASKGFVPLGVDPATVPDFPVEVGTSDAPASNDAASTTLYVRNGVATTAWVAVVAGGTSSGGQGYNAGLAVGCNDVPVGGQLVLVDRAPQDSGARTLLVLDTRTDASVAPAILWIDIAADGSVTHGSGIPPWWTDPAQPC
jgi:hypothetical protein